ncbi:hypothetical protein, partial [Streptomyces clavuligerus]|uniref:hypothetical protein n=1 Tax=Streptomyces clavuligerus TaxID=1901 RepID=UPI003F6893D3
MTSTERTRAGTGCVALGVGRGEEDVGVALGLGAVGRGPGGGPTEGESVGRGAPGRVGSDFRGPPRSGPVAEGFPDDGEADEVCGEGEGDGLDVPDREGRGER